MAKNDIRVDGMDFDKGLDFDFDMEPKKFSQMSKREVVTETVSGAWDGVKSEMANASKWRDAIRENMPKGFQQSWNAFDETSRTISDLYDQAEKEIKPALGAISKQLDDLVPEDMATLKKVTQKLRGWTGADDNAYKGGDSPDAVINKGAATLIEQTFNQMREERNQEAQEDTAREAVSQKIEQGRHEQTAKYFSRMDSNIQKQTLYLENVGIKVQKTMLEMSYRQYMTLGQIHLEQKRQGSMLEVQLADIKRNTGLPETVKIRTSDRFMESMKSRAMDSIQNKMFSEGSILTTGLKKITTDVQRLISEVGNGLQMGLLGLGAGSMAFDGGMGGSAPRTIGSMVGGEAGNWIRGKALKKFMPQFVKSEDFQELTQRLRRVALNPNYGIDEIKNTEFWKRLQEGKYGGQADKVLDYFQETFQPEKGSSSLDGGKGFQGGIDPESYTRRSSVVQNEVVPGYLARILREIARLRLKKNDVPLLVFDPVSGRFKNEAEMANILKNTILEDAKNDTGSYVAKSAADDLLKNLGVGDDTSEKLAQMLYELTNSGDTLKPESIRATDAYKTATPAEKAVFDLLASKTVGRSKDDYKITADVEESLADIRAGSSSQGAVLQQMIDMGFSTMLEDMGFVKRGSTGSLSRVTGRTDELKKEALRYQYKSLDELEGEDRERRLKELKAREEEERKKNAASGILETVSSFTRKDETKEPLKSPFERRSDVELKENFTVMPGKKALEGVKNIPISEWNYRDPRDGQGRFVGGMAQQINKQFGDAAAPNGKKINLVSMNGINMAAIQGLAQKQDELTQQLSLNAKGDFAQPKWEKESIPGHLVQIRDAIAEMHETLKSKAFGISIPGLDVDLKGLASGAAGAAKKMARPVIETGNFYIDSLQSYVVSGLNDIFGNVVKGGKKTYRGAEWLFGQAKGSVVNNKEWLTEKKDQLKKKIIEAGDWAVDRGLKFIKEDLPEGLKSGMNFLNKTKEKAKSLLSGPRDIYIRGSTSPVLTAKRMRAGMYANHKTGEVILSVDSLIKAKADIYDIGLGEVALTESEKADGLFDEDGNELFTLRDIATTAIKTAAIYAGGRLMTAAKESMGGIATFLKSGAKLSDMVAGLKASIAKKFEGFGKLAFFDKRETAILAQIRDLLAIGKPAKYLSQIYDRDLEDSKYLSGASFYQKLMKTSLLRFQEELGGGSGGSGGGSTESVEGKGDGGGGSSAPGSGFSLENLFGKKLGEKLGAKFKEANTGREGSKDFVGPSRPGHQTTMERAKDKLAELTGKKQKPELVGPVKKSYMAQKWDQAKNRAGEVKSSFSQGLRGTIMNAMGRETGAPVMVGPAPELVGPTAPIVPSKWQKAKGAVAGFGRGKLGLLSKGTELLGNIASGAGSLLGGMLGGPAPNTETQNDFGTAQSQYHVSDSNVRGLNDGVKGKNDADGDGNRDGGSTEMMQKSKEEEKERKAAEAQKAADAAKRAADSSLKYKSQENAIDRMIKLAGSVMTGIGGGIKELLSFAFDAFGSIPKLGKMLWSGAKMGGQGLWAGAKALGRGGLWAGRALGSGGLTALRAGAAAYSAGGIGGVASAALSSGSAALTAVRTVALASGTMSGTLAAGALTAGKVILGVLASPLFLKAAIVAGVAYGGYKLYKYMTRNSADEFQKLRLVQYGLKEKHDQQHRIMALEEYLLDGRVAYSNNPSIIQQKIKPEEILEIFDIKKEDKERTQKFWTWMNERFRPFFLKHIAAIFKANPKLKLNEAKKLTYSELQTYLDEAQYPDGPYKVKESPFSAEEEVQDTSGEIPEMVKLLRTSKKKDSKDKSSNTQDVTNNAKLVGSAAIAKAALEAENKRLAESAKKKDGSEPDKVKPKTPDNKATPDKLSPYEVSDDAGNNRPTSGTFRKGTNPEGGSGGTTTLPVAAGPLAKGDDGDRFLSPQSGVNLNGLNPEIKRYLTAMASEYGKLTGKQIPVTDGFRSYAEQASLYQRMPGKAAKPGSSMHEFGLAFDIDQKAANELEKMGLLRKYGFTRPVGGEPWHIEPAGLQLDINRAKKDAGWAHSQIVASPGRGGGGAGMTAGQRMKSRNPGLASELWLQGQSQVIEPKQGSEGKDASTPAPIPPATATGPKKDPNVQNAYFTTTAQKHPSMKGDTPVQMGSLGSVPTEPVKKGEEGSKPGAEGESAPTTSGPTSAKDSSLASGKGNANVRSEVIRAAQKAGMDPKLLLLYAAAESSMGTNTSSGTSSAQGPFQFMPKTWNEQVARNGPAYGVTAKDSPNDPYASGLMAAAYMRQNEKVIKSAGQGNPGIVDYYLTHLLGPTGAGRFLSMAPDEVAANRFGAAAKSNAALFFRNPRGMSDPYTAKEVREVLERKFQKLAMDYNIQGLQTSPSTSSPSGTVNSPSAVQPGTPEAAAAKPTAAEAPIQPKVQQASVQGPQKPDDGYTPPSEIIKANQVEQRRPVETLRGQNDIASGITAVMERSVDASVGLLKTVQNDVVPVLAGMKEILEKIYAGGGKMGSPGTTSPAAPSSSPQGKRDVIQASSSILDRERKYGG